MLDPHFVILGFVINLWFTAAYVLATLRGKTKPNRVTWFLWTLAPFVALVAQLSEGVGLSALQTFATGFTPLLVLLASFVNRRSVWRLTRFDMVCGVLSILGLLLWVVTRHADVAILFAILADGLAALPTVVKAWKYPETEHSAAYLGGGINAFIALLTIQHFTFVSSAFAFYILALCGLIFLLVQFKLGKRFQSLRSTLGTL